MTAFPNKLISTLRLASPISRKRCRFRCIDLPKSTHTQIDLSKKLIADAVTLGSSESFVWYTVQSLQLTDWYDFPMQPTDICKNQVNGFFIVNNNIIYL